MTTTMLDPDNSFAAPVIGADLRQPEGAQPYGAELALSIAQEAAAAIRGATDARMRAPERDHPKGHARWLAYWRMCSDPNCLESGHTARSGWITHGPGKRSRKGEEECSDFAKLKHATYLGDKYGEFSTYVADGDAYAPITRIPDLYLKHRLGFGHFMWLVRQPGGLMEFPVDQVRQLRWHIAPETRDLIAKFRPDACLRPDWPCEFGCTGLQQTFPEREQLNRHVEAVHSEKSEMVALAGLMRQPLDAIEKAVTGGLNDQSKLEHALSLIAQTNHQIATLVGGSPAAEQYPSGAVARSTRSRRTSAVDPEDEETE